MTDRIRMDSRLPVALAGLATCAAVSCVATPPDHVGADCPAPSPAPALSDAQRRAFLHYYSPIILKQADELLFPGRDWITNFDFDVDGKLHNNRAQWVFGLGGFVTGGNPTWQIRPTLYSHLIEFMEDGSKSLVLVYHVYHAMQIGSIHDWERIEIRIDGATADPGSGENIRFVVITEHKWHRAGDPAALSFHTTSQGKHVLIWQAPWGVSLAPGTPNAAQLNFVTDPWAVVDDLVQNDRTAKVHVEQDGAPLRRNFHYVFVDPADTIAKTYWDALTIEPATAAQRVAGVASSQAVAASSLERLQYELQDTADMLPLHLDPGGADTGGCSFCDWLCGCDEDCGDHGNPNWTCPRVAIEVDDPLVDTGGVVQIPAGRHDFLSQARDDINPLEDRRGYPRKHWYWGAYLFDKKGKFLSDAYENGAPNGTRGPASGHDSHDRYWYQHDYFAHNGARSTGSDGDAELGQWLCGGWHLSTSGGFDGRWNPLFP